MFTSLRFLSFLCAIGAMLLFQPGGGAVVKNVHAGQWGQYTKVVEPIPQPSSQQIDPIPVTVSGNFIVTGSNGGSRYSSNGSVFVYDKATGERRYTIQDQSYGEGVGSAIAASGNNLIVGAPKTRVQEGDFSGIGLVHVFDLSTGALKFTLGPIDDQDYNEGFHDFGALVDVNDHTLVVASKGLVFVYDLATEQLRFTISRVYFPTNLKQLALADDKIVIHQSGARATDITVYDAYTGNLIYNIAPDSQDSSFRFDRQIAADDNTIVIGSTVAADRSQAIPLKYQVHFYDAATGAERHRITLPVNEENARAWQDSRLYNTNGWLSVDVHGQRAVVGASWYDGEGVDSGGGFVYDVYSGALLEEISAFDAATSQYFGNQVAIEHDTIVVQSERGGACDRLNQFAISAVYFFGLESPVTPTTCAGSNTVSLSDVVVNESEGVAQARVYLSEPAADVLRVRVHTIPDPDGLNIATMDDDYRGLSIPVVFQPGEFEKTVRVMLIDDAAFEVSERFRLRLADVPQSRVDIARQISDVYIIDDDERLVLSVLGDTVNEGDGGATVRVNMSGPYLPQAVRFKLFTFYWNRSENLATPGFDYYGFTKEVVFEPGETEVSLTIPIVDDGLVEDTEFIPIYFVDRTSVTDLGIELGQINPSITIVDNDSDATLPTMSIEDLSVKENDGTANVRVLLSAPAVETLTAGIHSRPGTARPGSDFYGFSRTITFAPGATETVVPISIIDDLIHEDQESFQLRLFDVDPGKVIVAERFATVTISNDDSQP